MGNLPLRRFFCDPYAWPYTNLVLILLVFGANIFFQVFCRPAMWASVVLVISSINLVIYRLLNKKSLQLISAFVNGINICISIYCIIFLGEMNYLGLFLLVAFGLGALCYVPHFFVLQLLYHYLFRQKDMLVLQLFYAGILLSLVTSGFFGYWYYKKARYVAGKQSSLETISSDFMTERIIGMHFIYHTGMCYYDGWRPPVHDPALNVGRWITGISDPLQDMKLDKRIRLYKQAFPENEIKRNCACALQYQNEYFNSSLLIDQ